MSKASLVLRGDGLLHLQWEPGSRIEEEDAKAAMIAVDSICEDHRHPMLVDMEATASVSRAARTLFTRPSAVSRIALLGSSPVDRVIANFFLGLHTPPCPTRFFTSRADAMEWLTGP